MSEQNKDAERARVVDAMCMTWRHDFGLDKQADELGSCGMTDAELDALRRQMGQLYDHHFAARSLPVGVPDGYALVPVEPTPEMLEAAWNYHGSPAYTSEVRPDSLTDAECYRAMLAAAPAAPTVKAEQVRYSVEDLQKEALNAGLQYVRESDDHYVTGTTEQALDFIRNMIGVDIRLTDAAPSLPAAGSADQPYQDGIAEDLERSDWTPLEALQWYAAGKHFDTVGGRTRIIDTGAVASNALKHASLPYLEMKGDAELSELRAIISEAAAGSAGEEPTTTMIQAACAAFRMDVSPMQAMQAALRAALSAQQSVDTIDFNWPEYNDQGMGCGLEDRGITDRYEAMRYGWECAIEQLRECIPGQQSAPERVSVPVELLERLETWVTNDCWALDELRALLASHGRGEA